VASNIADPSQIKKQERKAKDIRRQELNDIRTVLSNASGRRLLWRLLEECKTFAAVFKDNPSYMSYLSGKQDLGHFLMSEITEADENLLLKMMKDNSKKEDI